MKMKKKNKEETNCKKNTHTHTRHTIHLKQLINMRIEMKMISIWKIVIDSHIRPVNFQFLDNLSIWWYIQSYSRPQLLHKPLSPSPPLHFHACKTLSLNDWLQLKDFWTFKKGNKNGSGRNRAFNLRYLDIRPINGDNFSCVGCKHFAYSLCYWMNF